MNAPFSSAVEGRDPPGWYGKLPALGDFAQRRLPADFVQSCDGWLSRAMEGSREELGESWLDIYLTAPVLRFAWAPGVFDPNWWFGVLMPSCDTVGRYFPLLIAQRRPRPPMDRIAFDHLELWFDQLAMAAVETLGEGAPLDQFEDSLAAASPWATPGAVTTVSYQSGASGTHYELAMNASLGDMLQVVAAQDVQARFAGCSLWWRKPQSGGRSHVKAFRGLPDGAGFAALLTGAR